MLKYLTIVQNLKDGKVFKNRSELKMLKNLNVLRNTFKIKNLNLKR